MYNFKNLFINKFSSLKYDYKEKEWIIYLLNWIYDVLLQYNKKIELGTIRGIWVVLLSYTFSVSIW